MINLEKLDISMYELLDALPDATAVVDSHGTIIAVNGKWNAFAKDNGGDGSSVGIGANYLEVCARSASFGCVDAEIVSNELKYVLSGDAVEREIEYSCASPEIGRWFLLRITPIGNPPTGALVAHLNITTRKVAELDLERKASIDPLTGINNRRSFCNKLSYALNPRRAPKSKYNIGVIYLDLDKFKPINDKFGHAMGDEILQLISLRLLSAIRKGAAVGRLGGDEFAVLIPRVTDVELDQVISRIKRALAEPYHVDGQIVNVAVSVGAYLANLGEDPDTCLRMADEAMYAIKRRKSVS